MHSTLTQDAINFRGGRRRGEKRRNVLRISPHKGSANRHPETVSWANWSVAGKSAGSAGSRATRGKAKGRRSTDQGEGGRRRRRRATAGEASSLPPRRMREEQVGSRRSGPTTTRESRSAASCAQHAGEARTGVHRETRRERERLTARREFVGRPSPARPFFPIASRCARCCSRSRRRPIPDRIEEKGTWTTGLTTCE